MVLPETLWEPALDRARPVLRLLARQRLPQRLWKRLDPSDMVQITLQEAHEKRMQFRGDSEEQLLSWLHFMLINRLYDQIRACLAQKRDARLAVPLVRTSARLRSELVASGRSPSQVVMNREILDRLCSALEVLPEDERLVVEFVHLQGLCLSEVGDLMDKSRFAVARLLRRGLEHLREALKDLG